MAMFGSKSRTKAQMRRIRKRTSKLHSKTHALRIELRRKARALFEEAIKTVPSGETWTNPISGVTYTIR